MAKQRLTFDEYYRVIQEPHNHCLEARLLCGTEPDVIEEIVWCALLLSSRNGLLHEYQ